MFFFALEKVFIETANKSLVEGKKVIIDGGCFLLSTVEEDEGWKKCPY